jgi:hypothetical protein
LSISALGLVVAGAVGLTTEAQTTDGELSGLPETSSRLVVPAEQAADKQSSKAATFPAFARREEPTTDRPTRSAALRDAIVKEQAASTYQLSSATTENALTRHLSARSR